MEYSAAEELDRDDLNRLLLEAFKQITNEEEPSKNTDTAQSIKTKPITANSHIHCESDNFL